MINKFSLICLLFLLPVHSSSAAEIKNILLLNSYHQGFKWTHDVTNGIINAFQTNHGYRIFIENIDYKRFPDEKHIQNLTQVYKFKYKNIKLEGIICSDNFAFQYLLDQGDSIWNTNIPISVCGVNNTNTFKCNKKEVSFIEEKIDIYNTIKLIYDLNPKTDTLIAISDHTLSGNIFISQFINELKLFKDTIPYKIIHTSDKDSLVHELNMVNTKNKAVLLFSLYLKNQDPSNEIISIGKEIFNNFPIPVYSFWDFLLDDFIIGGNLICGHDQGLYAATNLLSRLNNPKLAPNSITPCFYKLTCDFKKINDLKINESNIPKNAILINKDISFFKKNKDKLLSYIIAILTLLILNTLLIINIILKKKTQNKLKESEKRLELALDSANEGLWDIQLTDKRFTYNNNFAKLFGYNKTSEINFDLDSWQKLIYKDDLPQLTINLKKHLNNQSSFFQTESRIYTKDKTLKWVSIHGKITQTDKNKKPYRLTGIIIDIDTKKEFEIQLKKAKQKAEESDQLKSSFLANMSHEIRTPMNAILGFSDILQSQKLEKSQQDEYLELIKNSGENLLNIINDIVDISKIESGQLHIRKENFDVNKLIKKLSTTAQTLIKSKNKNIEFININNNHTLPVYIYNDPYRLEQILLNLISNAIKFTHTGNITLQQRKQNEKELIIEVIDTGEGITSKDISIIFERFRQAENSSHHKNGTGLGLSISKSLIELMGGDINVHSIPNKGSVFAITIPINKISLS